MFLRMVRGVLIRQRGKMFMIAFTIALGASLATAMLSVMFDVGDKVNQELKAYGANITVVPKESSVVGSLYEVEGGDAGAAYLDESELGRIKTIFWAFNIVDFAPLIDAVVDVDGREATLVGSWFNHHLDLPTGEELDTGIVNLRTWWEIVDGQWLDEQAQGGASKVMVGVALANELGIRAGDTVAIQARDGQGDYEVAGIYSSGGDEDGQILAPLDLVQELTGTDGKLTSIDVSALTTPDNELSRKAAEDPSKLTNAQYETWYCTAYVSSICYQLQEVITDAVASPVRQVADSEGAILEKTQLLMVLITILALLGSALGISNLIIASVMERSQEIGLFKAIGASDRAVSALLLVEMVAVGIGGGIVGLGVGYGFAQVIGRTVFDAGISLSPAVVPLVAVLVVTVTLIGSIPAIRTVLRLDPAEVLHGR